MSKSVVLLLSAMLLSGALLPGLAHADASEFVLGELHFRACDLKDRTDGVLLGARCARLSVPEDPAAPDGRQISLRIGIASAQTANPLPDPVFLFAGGPGQSAVEAYPEVAAGFARLRERRHVILVDQRGTGDSNPLKCEDAEGSSGFSAEDASDAAQTAFVQRCLEKLADRADPRFYTTSVAVGDIDRVRAAIGAEQINLIGVSYGTRAAQVYLRQFPDRVRSVVLDGVVPPSLVLGMDHARNLETAVQGIFARCREDADCHRAFGDPAVDLDRLLAELRAAPLPVSFRDPKSGEMLKEELSAYDVIGVVRLFAYSPEISALLPLALHEAVESRPEVLMAHSRLISGDFGEQFMHGMQLSVICSEDADLYRERPEDEATLLGTAFVHTMQVQCAAWPKGSRPDDFHQPRPSEHPVLLLSGEFDPVTPPAYGDETLKQFGNGRHLVVPGRGHGQLNIGCMPRLLSAFIDAADASGLDAKCLDTISAIPPFVNPNGWTP